MDRATKRRWRLVALGIGGAVLAALVLALGPFVIMAAEGSGMDPRIPSALHVPPSIAPALREHTRIYDRKVYKVGDNVYCAVGWGLANIIMVEGTDGVIVVDTGESLDQARDVLAELRKVSAKPVAAVVLTHHHADHVLGTSVFVTADDVAQGKVPVFAHESLVRHYVEENGAIAELQTIRSTHMYGAALLPADREGGNNGIGPYIGRGEGGFVAPNRTFSDKLDATVAGIRMQMLYVPSEAESEIAVYLPDEKILLSAEVIQDHTFPNMYTIRGARYRDPVTWVRSIDALRELDSGAMVLQHGPPVVGHDEVARVLTIYRDEIQFVHDQTVRFMNQGMTAVEIAERVKLPPHLASADPWGTQFYGSVEASVRNVYGGYVGWFQGDPVDLSPTDPAEYARRTVSMMGGRDAVLAAARAAYDKGDNQFAAELATPLVRIDKHDMDARHLKAAAFRKIGYASANANYRNYFLVSAMELDDQIPSAIYLHEAAKKLSSGFKGLPAANQVESLAPRLKAEETLDQDVAFVVRYGSGEAFSLHVRRGVLEVAHGARPSPAFELAVTTDAMGAVLAGGALDDGIAGGAITVSGDATLAKKVFTWFERPFTSKPEVVVR